MGGETGGNFEIETMITPNQKKIARPLPPFISELRTKIRDGDKTVTRRLHGLEKINERPETFSYRGKNDKGDFIFYDHERWDDVPLAKTDLVIVKSKYGQVGDICYLREPIERKRIQNGKGIRSIAIYADDSEPVQYNGHSKPWKWQNKALSQLHLPRKLARIFFKTYSICPERLNDITDLDARREGFNATEIRPARKVFLQKFEELNGREAVELNPWVWRIEFGQIY